MAERFTCCKDLREAVEFEFDSNFLIQADVLYLTVGTVQTPEGPGMFDMAVLFCPFCGTQLQTREEVADKARNL